MRGRWERIVAATPHRHPMLLVDRLDELEAGRRGVGHKLVSASESHREGAADGSAGAVELPSSLLVDALGQVAIAALSGGTGGDDLYYLAALEGLELGPAARCGDAVRMEARLLRTWRGTSRVEVEAVVGDTVVARGVMVLAARSGTAQRNGERRNGGGR